MGDLVAPRGIQVVAWIVAVIIAALNAYLLYQTFTGE
jgi:manganese transport protein